MKTSRSLIITTVTAAVAALTLAAAPLAAPAASADPAPSQTKATEQATDQTGWLRLAHLSPDTKAVDVRVSALGGGSTEFVLEGVRYGDVSGYETLPAGDYAISMVPQGAAPDATPVLSATAEIAAGGAATVTAYGPNDDLQVRAFSDDLTLPGEGKARIRLIQASTQADAVDVATSTGIALARGAVAGTVTDYAEIDAGPWTLDLTAGRQTDSVDIDVAPGSVTTLFVLDTSTGDLTVNPVLDSRATGDVPVGGVATGGGGTAGLDARWSALIADVLRAFASVTHPAGAP